MDGRGNYHIAGLLCTCEIPRDEEGAKEGRYRHEAKLLVCDKHPKTPSMHDVEDP
jgi:hypothetical protein